MMTDPTVALGVVAVTVPIGGLLLFVAMAAVTFAMGVYLVATNPPKDDASFVGFGKEKYTNEELAARKGGDGSDTDAR